MITYVRGDLFESPAKVLVNTVNTKGVMGKGVALRFKSIYPEMFSEYQRYCESGKLTIGRLYLYKTSHKWILNFPTKQHWRSPSRIEYIEAGLDKFINIYADLGITSVAFPALGCGNGELDFQTQTKPIMERYLRDLPIPTFIYPSSRQRTPPEHKDIERIKAWLRSEPEVLSFDEVWRDISEVLKGHSTFRTFTKANIYTAHALADRPGIKIEAAGKAYTLDQDILLEFWQQIRDYGFTHRNIVPDYYRISYLLPIFDQLPYIRRVDSSTSFRHLDHNPTIGLQIIPYPAERWETSSIFTYALDAPQG